MRIARGDVHVWTLDLETPVDLASLAADERERADRYRSPAQREHFRRRRAMMRAILSGYVGESPADIRYARNRHGKPVLCNSDLTFSVASRDGCALLAIATNDEIGIDLERIRPLPDLDALIDRYVAPIDRAAFAALDRPSRERRFLQHWTAIEASLKARGTGFDGVADGSTFVVQAAHLYQFEPSATYVATLASHAPVDTVVHSAYGPAAR